MSVRTDDLIADLARRAAPVKPLPAPGVRILAWLAIAVAAALLGVLVFGARRDLGDRLSNGMFLLTAILEFGVALFAALAALTFAVPGAGRGRLFGSVAAHLLGVWIGTLIFGIVGAERGFSGISDWYVCFVRVAAVGLVPGAALVVMLTRAAPLHRARTASLGFGAAAAIGSLSVQLVCPVDDAGHALLGHLGPVMILLLAGFAAGQALFKPASMSDVATTR